MRTKSIEPCSRCGTPTNYYDGNAGRMCPSCEWQFIYNFKIGLFAARRGITLSEEIEDIRYEDDGSCVLGKSREEWLKRAPNIRTGIEYDEHGVWWGEEFKA